MYQLTNSATRKLRNCRENLFTKSSLNLIKMSSLAKCEKKGNLHPVCVYICIAKRCKLTQLSQDKLFIKLSSDKEAKKLRRYK